MTVTFDFPAPDRPLNLNDRLHWARKAERVRNWRTAARWAAYYALQLGRHRRPAAPSTVTLTIPVRNPNARRDPGNWAPTTKAVVDGLVDAGLWPDDNSQWVTTTEPRFRKGGPVTVTIEPRP